MSDHQTMIFPASGRGLLIVGLAQGADLHDDLIAACHREGVDDGIIVEGHATLDPAVIHNVTSTGLPVDEHVRTLGGPWEMVSLSGLLIDGELHAHLAIADDHRTTGGHLHPGTRVLYLAEIAVLAISADPSLTRAHHPETKLWLLERKGIDS